MAEAPKNFGGALTTTPTTVYTCPLGKTAMVTLFHVTNVDGVNDADLFASWFDASDSDAENRFAHATQVKAKGSFHALERPLNLEGGDYIKAFASADGDLELTGSVVEIS